MNCYVAIKDILRARAADLVDSTKSSEVGSTDMLQNLSQDIDWDRRHDDGYGASLCPSRSKMRPYKAQEIARLSLYDQLW